MDSNTGAFYVTDSQHGRLRKVSPTGRSRPSRAPAAPARAATAARPPTPRSASPTGVAVGRGAVYVSDRIHHTVWRLNPDGTITRFAGSGTSGGEGDGGAPQQAQLSFPQALAVAPDASLLIGDAGNGRVRRATVGLPGFNDASFSLPSQDGGEVYQFDAGGRHLRTVDALTGSVRYSFGYDAAGRLTTITDGDGNVTTITRGAGGIATGIVAPGSGTKRTTALTVEDGDLTSVTNPAGDETAMTYDAGGLLKTFTDPRGNAASLRLRRGQRPALDRHRRRRRRDELRAHGDGRRRAGQAHVTGRARHGLRDRHRLVGRHARRRSRSPRARSAAPSSAPTA